MFAPRYGIIDKRFAQNIKTNQNTKVVSAQMKYTLHSLWYAHVIVANNSNEPDESAGRN